MIKLQPMRAETKVRKNSGSLATTIPIAMAQILGIEAGDTLRWQLNPKDGSIKVFPREKD